jgi:hypothetical protein
VTTKSDEKVFCIHPVYQDPDWKLAGQLCKTPGIETKICPSGKGDSTLLLQSQIKDHPELEQQYQLQSAGIIPPGNIIAKSGINKYSTQWQAVCRPIWHQQPDAFY